MRVDTGRLRVVGHDAADADALVDPNALTDAAVQPSDGEVPSPGGFIAAQRRRRGLSIEQLAVATKIPARSLELLEADRFEDLPGPVFVKGFLRCAARALGVSHHAVLELLYERERATLQARRHGRAEPRATTGVHAATNVRALPTTSGLGSIASRRAAAHGEPGPWSRLRASLPSAHALWWVVVAIAVAFLVLAAFNLAGAPVGQQS